MTGMQNASADRTRVRTFLAQAAGEHICYGFDLGRRGALHSARDEFVRALQLVAWELDRAHQTDTRERALAEALCALRESDDFVLAGSVDVSAISSTHQTAALHGAASASATPLDALQLYYQYAKNQLVLAGDSDPVAAQAVHGLARVEVAMCNVDPTARGARGPKAIALYQAAVLIDPTNYRATRELGVVLARFGQLRQAKETFSRSLSLHSDSLTWDNMAVVCEGLGEWQLAQQARRQSQTLAYESDGRDAQSEVGNRDPDAIVQWVDLNTFIEKSDLEPTAVAAQPSVRTASVHSQPERDSSPSLWKHVFKGLVPGNTTSGPITTPTQTTNRPDKRSQVN